MEDFEREIKVVVVGNGGVGKTSMIKRCCKGVFTDDYKKTIGVDFLEKQLYVPSIGQDVQLYLWDTAGQEEFDSITKTYYRGAGAAVLAFSTTDRASFDALPSWRSKVLEQCPGIAMALVQNKVDLIEQAVVSSEEAEAMARRLGLKFYRTCVKQDLNVTEVFTYLAELHDRKLNSGHLQQGQAMPVLEAGLAAAADSIEPAQNSSHHGPGVTATISPPAAEEGQLPAAHQKQQQQQQQHKAGVTAGEARSGSSSVGGYGRKALPASVELHPSVQRGKKSVATKIKRKLAKASFTECSIQ
ncbi:hypothetical protein OEZ86_008966 [Tetradesmus obliquus]|nr:hypothetical protein OEZ86_008966 [Tetradesmus obliquus]